MNISALAGVLFLSLSLPAQSFPARSFPAASLGAAALAASPANEAPASRGTTALLPRAFAGWEISPGARSGTDPASVDSAHSDVLKEYGFSGYEVAAYSQSGRKLAVRAARFQDATGAYGAFTFYRTPAMRTEKIGTMAASDNDCVLFFSGNVLVEANFDEITGMSAAQLRELAAALPVVTGAIANLPPLAGYFPSESTVANSAKFALGPAAYAALGLPIPGNLVDFNHAPEILAGKISQPEGDADLILIEYPTPRIATERTSAFESANFAQGTTFVVKRTGPIVKMVYGAISEQEGNALLGRINYQANVTWNENTGLSKRDNIGDLVIAALTLAAIIFVFSLGPGAVFGFRQAILSRVFPQRFRPPGEEERIIRLNLRK